MQISPSTMLVTEEWFTALYLEHLPIVRTYLCTIIPLMPNKWELVDDLLQQTFLQAWRSRDRLNWSTPKPLLIAIAHRLYIDDWRKHQTLRVTAWSHLRYAESAFSSESAHHKNMRMLDGLLSDEHADEQSNPETIYTDGESLTALLNLIGTALGVRDRTLLYLRLSGLKSSQIADVLGDTTASAVKSRWFRLRGVLRKAAIELLAKWHTTHPDATWPAFEKLLAK